MELNIVIFVVALVLCSNFSFFLKGRVGKNM